MEAKLEFGERLAAWRAAKKMTQGKLAQAAGMLQEAISNLERGHRGKAPALDTVQRLATALGLSIEKLTTTMPSPVAEPELRGRPRKVGRPRRPSMKPKPKKKGKGE
jgi:transcriptional regulator with XRE-family HTH domain